MFVSIAWLMSPFPWCRYRLFAVAIEVIARLHVLTFLYDVVDYMQVEIIKLAV